MTITKESWDILQPKILSIQDRLTAIKAGEIGELRSCISDLHADIKKYNKDLSAKVIVNWEDFDAQYKSENNERAKLTLLDSFRSSAITTAINFLSGFQII